MCTCSCIFEYLANDQFQIVVKWTLAVISLGLGLVTEAICLPIQAVVNLNWIGSYVQMFDRGVQWARFKFYWKSYLIWIELVPTGLRWVLTLHMGKGKSWDIMILYKYFREHSWLIFHAYRPVTNVKLDIIYKWHSRKVEYCISAKT